MTRSEWFSLVSRRYVEIFGEAPDLTRCLFSLIENGHLFYEFAGDDSQKSIFVDNAAQVLRGPKLRNKKQTIGYVYLAAFANGTFKVGRAKCVDSRLKHLNDKGLIEKTWSSDCLKDCHAAERMMIKALRSSFEIAAGKETFRGSYHDAVALAENLL